MSRVLNNPGIVAEPLRSRIRSTVDRLGYRPNPFASRLGSKSGWGLALFVFDILNPFFARIVRKIGHLALEQRIPFTICDTENNEEKERLYLDYLLENRIGGVIFTEGMASSSITRARAHTEVVLIDRECGDEDIAVISSDNYRGARQAVEYLIQLNHERIGFVSGPTGWASAAARKRGYEDALTSAGIDGDPSLVFTGDLRFESGIAALDYFLSQPVWPTAIFCANDQMAFGVHSKATALNISIPGDISLVGFDDIPVYSLHNSVLTTVRQRTDELCERAFSVMLAKLRGESIDESDRAVVVPTELKIGNTCRKVERSQRHDGERLTREIN